MPIYSTSNTLSANIAHPVLNSDGRDDKEHSYVYRASDILHHSSIQLTRGGMILIGLLSGGDYSEGVQGCGIKTAHGLARCGFGDELLEAVQTHSRGDLPAFLTDWRARIRQELTTNSREMLDKRMLKLSREWPENFPDLDVLYLYTDPVTSKTDASARRTHIPLAWEKEPDFGKIANVCEIYFEWGFEEAIIKRFRTVLWNGAVQRVFRRAALEEDARRRGDPTVARKQTSPAGMDYIGTPYALIKEYFSEADVVPPETALITRIHAVRNHAITDRLLEYRISILPELLVKICKAGLKGTRSPVDTTFDVLPGDREDEGDDDGTCKKQRALKEAVDPLSPYRVWVAASIVRLVRPDLLEEFESREARKVAAKTAKAARAEVKQGATAGTSSKPERKTRKKAPADLTLRASEEDAEDDDTGNVCGSDHCAGKSTTHASHPKPASKARRVGKPAAVPGRSRKKALGSFSSFRNNDIDIVEETPHSAVVRLARFKPPSSYLPLRLEDEDSPDSAPLPQINSRRKLSVPSPLYLEDEDSLDTTSLLRFDSRPKPASRSPLYTEDKESAVAAPRPYFSSQPVAGPSNSMKSFFTVSKTAVAAKGQGLAKSSAINRTVDLTVRRPPEPLIATPSTVVSRTVTSAIPTNMAASGGSAILDRLDKAAAKSRKFKRSESSNFPIPATSSVSAPRPFPLVFEEPFFSDDDQNPPPPPLLPPQRTHLEQIHSGRRARAPSLTQCSDSDSPRKSPRHDTWHSSPRRNAVELGLSLMPSTPRRQPRSPPHAAAGGRPLPAHRPRKFDDSIIEIDSNSSADDENLSSGGNTIAMATVPTSAPPKGTAYAPSTLR